TELRMNWQVGAAGNTKYGLLEHVRTHPSRCVELDHRIGPFGAMMSGALALANRRMWQIRFN
ncbi:MAG TPA: hypothetical protein PK819_10950, partial [Thermomicrobiales bacterium]|nr:hypothetical protein [Thermomicrobiales bacterium]